MTNMVFNPHMKSQKEQKKQQYLNSDQYITILLENNGFHPDDIKQYKELINLKQIHLLCQRKVKKLKT